MYIMVIYQPNNLDSMEANKPLYDLSTPYAITFPLTPCGLAFVAELSHQRFEKSTPMLLLLIKTKRNITVSL